MEKRPAVAHARPAEPANLLLDDRDGHVWPIDWDDSVVAPPEHDLILVLTGLLADPVTGDQQVSLRAEAPPPAGDHRYRHAPDHELRLEY